MRKTFILAALLNLAIIVFFHNRAWIAADDGIYAHIAERLLSGEVLNRDISEAHPGYIHFVNAAAMKFFGRDIVSMRYPAAAAAFLQSLLVFLLFSSGGVLIAFVASLASACLGFVEISSPSSHIYATLLTTLMIFVLQKVPTEKKWRIFLVGVLLSTLFLFRQLTAAFTGMGTLAFLLLEARGTERNSSIVAKSVLFAEISLILAYLAQGTTPLGCLLIGIWPFLALVFSMKFLTVSNRRTITILAELLCGSAIGFIPILAYHLIHGSLPFWISDVFVTAFRLTSLKHVSTVRYDHYLMHIWKMPWGSSSLPVALNALYWLALLFIPAVNGYLFFRDLLKHARFSDIPGGALRITAVFFALVSLFNQIPFYLYVTSGLSLAAILSARRSRLILFPALAICAIAIFFHAGQPYDRSFEQVWAGERVPAVYAGEKIPKLHLWISSAQLENYSRLVDLIQRESAPAEGIFTMPNSPEIFFLSDRKNPLRIWNTAISAMDVSEAEKLATEITGHLPKLVIYHKNDLYETSAGLLVLDRLKAKYSLLTNVERYAVYRIND